MLTLLIALLVLALVVILALLVAGAELVRERDEWQALALSLMEESADGAEATR